MDVIRDWLFLSQHTSFELAVKECEQYIVSNMEYIMSTQSYTKESNEVIELFISKFYCQSPVLRGQIINVILNMGKGKKRKRDTIEESDEERDKKRLKDSEDKNKILQLVDELNKKCSMDKTGFYWKTTKQHSVPGLLY